MERATSIYIYICIYLLSICISLNNQSISFPSSSQKHNHCNQKHLHDSKNHKKNKNRIKKQFTFEKQLSMQHTRIYQLHICISLSTISQSVPLLASKNTINEIKKKKKKPPQLEKNRSDYNNLNQKKEKNAA